MKAAITSFSQHALDRFKERAGIRLRDDLHACEKLWEITQAATLQEHRPDGLVYAAKGWRMIVTKKCVRTMYLNRTVKNKRQVYREL